MTQFVCIADFVVGRRALTFLGSGSVEIALQRGAGQCDETATGAERFVQTILLLPTLGMLVRIMGGTRARRGETLCLDQAMRRPRFGSLMWCLLEDRLVRGWRRHFSKYEKMVLPPSKEERTKEREQLFWGKVQFQNRLRKQEAGHAEPIAEREADAAKQRTML